MFGVRLGFKNYFWIYSCSSRTFIFYSSFNSEFWFWLTVGVIVTFWGPIINEYTLNSTLQGQQLHMQFLLHTSSCATVISCVHFSWNGYSFVPTLPYENLVPFAPFKTTEDAQALQHYLSFDFFPLQVDLYFRCWRFFLRWQSCLGFYHCRGADQIM